MRAETGKKVLIISGAFPPMRAGEADHAFLLSKHLADRGFDVHVLTSSKWSMGARHPGLTVHPIMRDWSWSDLPRFVTFVKRSSPEVVLLICIGFIYDYHHMITFAPTIVKRIVPGVRFVTQFENVSGAYLKRATLLNRLILKGIRLWAGTEGLDAGFSTLLRDSDRIIVLSDKHRMMFSDQFPGLDGKCVVIPPPPLVHKIPRKRGATRKRGRECLGIQPEEFVVLYFGRIYPSKGIEILLEAFRLVVSHRNNVRLVLVGGAMDKEHKQYPFYARDISEVPDSLGIADKVIWTGEYACNSDEPSLYLRAADVCVLPFDGGVQLNNSSFAAAATHGLPIITTQGEMLEPQFIHRENVFLCPPKNAEAIAAAIEGMIDDAVLRRRLGVGALRLSQEWFPWKKAIERTIAACGMER